MVEGIGNRAARDTARQIRLAQQIDQTQRQITTGTRLSRASDDPIAAARVARLDRGAASSAAWQANLVAAGAQVAQADTVMGNVAALAARAKEVMLVAANGTASAADRGTAAQELYALAAEMASLAGTRTPAGDPLFPDNARAIRFGADTVFAPIPGRAALFSVGSTSIPAQLASLASAARGNDLAAMQAGLAQMDTVIAHVADQRAAIGLAGARLDRLADGAAQNAIDAATERSALADTDLTQAIATLNAQQLTLDAARAAFSRINRQTLFDFLR
jgi:flagellar hook-associated protein 3 FlgL